MNRLVAAVKEVRELQKLVLEEQRVLAAIELADIYGVTCLKELVLVVCPKGFPSVPVFDCLADGYALRGVRDAGKPAKVK